MGSATFNGSHDLKKIVSINIMAQSIPLLYMTTECYIIKN